MPARDPVLEQEILSGLRPPEEGLFYAEEEIQGRWPEWETLILQQAAEQPLLLFLCNSYAVDVIKGKWPDLEPLLFHVAGTFAKCADIDCVEAVVDYARDVIKGPWPSFESLVLDGKCRLDIAIEYTAQARGGRWEDFEKFLLGLAPKDAMPTLVHYAIGVIGGTWPAAETYFLNHHSDELFTRVVSWYAEHAVKGELPPDLHQMMTMMSFRDLEDEGVKSYFEFLKTLQR